MTQPDDQTCPQCGRRDHFWLYETEKECKTCGTTWLSAWALALNDRKETPNA